MTSQPLAAIYTRISRDADGDGVGVQRQETLCRELAERQGLQVSAVYTDNDIGASDRTGSKVRPSYDRMLGDAAAGAFSHILAYSNSRLTRRLRELEDLIKLHESTGITIQTVSAGQDDLSTSDGRMVARIKASVDAAESDRISERQRAAFRDNALAGKPKLQRQRPFGWEKDGVTLEPDEAELIRKAVTRIKGGASIASISDEWEAAGVPTAAGGEKWEWSVVHRVLLGWRTAGVRTYRREPLYDAEGELVMGAWTPIISLEDRAAAIAALEKRSRKKVRQGKWLLSGLIRCGECGSKMYGILSGAGTYGCKQGHNSITASNLENHVRTQLALRIIERNERAAKASGLKAPGQKLDWPDEEKLALVSRNIDELMEAFKAGQLQGSIVFPQVVELENERSALRSDRDRFYAEQTLREEEFRSSQEIWDHAAAQALLLPPVRYDEDGEHPVEDPNEADKKLLLQRELETIVVKKGQRGRAGWGREAFLERVDLIWREQHEG